MTTHTSVSFDFTVGASIDVAFPLFGADKERAWAPGWNPRYLWPDAAGDRQGMAFTVAHGNKTAFWVNTVFDRDAKQIQYVYVIPEVVVTVITLKLSPHSGTTDVQVTYDRTALTDDANHVVDEMAEQDKLAGPEWSAQIKGYLELTCTLRL